MSVRTLVLALATTSLTVLIACDGDKSGESGGIDTNDIGVEDDTEDGDGDGYPASEDCDDTDADVNPGATEICDGIDNDCDGQADEDVTGIWYQDADGDGYGDTDKTNESCDQPEGYVADDGDCDDANAEVNPGATEVCNEIDDDCNGEIDDAGGSIWYADADGDGYGDADTFSESCEGATGYVADSSDCDDTNELINPGADEVCDGVDNDCDILVDDEDDSLVDGNTYYADSDGDDWGYTYDTVEACEAPSGYVETDGDCDDEEFRVNPDADEVCDSIDNDCDGLVDSDDDSLDPTSESLWYFDYDADGYGDPDVSELACDAPSGYVSDSSDCDDTEFTINPSATEICDDLDNDCDGLIDGDDPSVDLSTAGDYYADVDGDGYGDASNTTSACDAPSGYVENDVDCDDLDAAVNPYADEVCDGADNDCDGLVDDDDDSLDTSTGSTYYADTDGDSFGDPDNSTEACSAGGIWVEDSTDCDDGDSAVNPDGSEICNSIDDDCDGLIDADDPSNDSSTSSTYYADADGDSYGDASRSVEDCSAPSGYVGNDEDCDDLDATINPAADETCDDADQDCDSVIDEEPIDGDWYAVDDDGDGFGAEGTAELACEGSDNELDCDDSDPTEPVLVDAAGAGDYTTIQDGIDNATACVVVDPGTYTETIDFGGADLSVSSSGGADVTTIDGTALGAPVVTFSSSETASAMLSGFTLTGGEGYLEETSNSWPCYSDYECTDYYTTYCGGGVFVDGADPTLADLYIVDNQLEAASVYSPDGNDYYYTYSYGGGVCVLNGAPTLSGVDVDGNYADQGGGYYVDEYSSVDVSQGWILENSATDGGGVQVDGGTLTVTNVASLWNAADSDGGGVLAIDGELAATNVTWAGESGTAGGALYASGTSNAVVTNSIIYGSTGEGVLADALARFDGTYNNVYGNTTDYSGVTDPTSTFGNISADPLFSDYLGGDLSLGVGSPSIDAGNPGGTYDDADGTVNDQGAWGGSGSDWN